VKLADLSERIWLPQNEIPSALIEDFHARKTMTGLERKRVKQMRLKRTTSV